MKQTIKNKKYKYGFHSKAKPVYQTQKGLSESVVNAISNEKKEARWMNEARLLALRAFQTARLPNWGPDLSEINFEKIVYYVKPADRRAKSWKDVPKNIKDTFERLGVPEAERKFFAGVGAQFDSEMIYHNIHKHLEKQGVIFCDTDTALKKHPKLFKKYFGTVVPATDNKFASLNAAEGSSVHYIEGCTAPVYSSDSLHAAVVEVIAKKGARVRYTTVQNWSNNVYNLVTKRARAEENALIEWVDGNIGSKATMKYPSVILAGKGAKADILSVALAGRGQFQDTGARVIHAAPDTSSNIIAKSVSFGGGKTVFRGMTHIKNGAKNSRAKTRCDTLMLGKKSRSDTYPAIKADEEDVRAEHEATVSKVGEKELFYLQSRGFSETEAASLIVAGFLEPFAKTLPMDYAIELNRLIQMEMENSIGLTRLSR